MEDWYYNEFHQIGIDFNSEEEVRIYDEKFKTLRNLDNEADFIYNSSGLNRESVVLEIGTGTGELALRLSKRCKKIVACDISKTMLSYAEKKVKACNIQNIEFVNTGFLNHNFNCGYFDAVISQLALHHLPDFWKSIAIMNISNDLKPGGIFYLMDAILSFETKNYKKAISGIISMAKEKMGEKKSEEVIVNIRDEYPTYDWIIEGLLEKNNLKILKKIKYTDLILVYINVKI
jgi:putative AdoMet-dependent methyltransferase